MEDSQKITQSKDLYRIVYDVVPSNIIRSKNKAKSWKYGHDEKYDIVVISKDGTIGDVYEIDGFRVALPQTPPQKDCRSRSNKRADQHWEPKEYPRELSKVTSIFQWRKAPSSFKDKWVKYIEDAFEVREKGDWFLNNGTPTYLTGSHNQYLQWSKIDVGLPDFREANRILYIFWEGCKADKRCYGMIYLKIRRSGFSFMEASETVNTATLAKDARIGILSKSGPDAKKMFTDKVVPMSVNYPFFFKPIQDGMDKPKTELSYQVPAAKITKKNMNTVFEEDDVEGLNTSIDWKNTGDNSYDGEKLLLLAHDESGKWLKPDTIQNNWRVTKTCLRLGAKIIGKCMMGSTCNALAKGGEEFKKLYYDSNVNRRSRFGQTKSGMYSLFIPMEWNMEGFIDLYGMPIIEAPEVPVMTMARHIVFGTVIGIISKPIFEEKK